MKQLPHTARDLIDALDKAYPPRCIGPSQTPEGAHRYAGSRELIDFLISLRDRQDRRHEDRILE